MRLIPLAFLLTLSLCVCAPVARAQDGQELMREGNTLFRSGLFGAALRRYQEATVAGLDTPLLHYNMGVAQYRLGRYAEAGAEFERASSDTKLAPLAYYNLGLASRALGDRAQAERWFNRVLESTQRTDLRTLATRALNRSAAEPRAAAAERAAEGRAPAQPVGDLTLLVLARYGQDDNIYRTPSAPYVDLAQSGQPLVTPVVQSAPFIPLDVLARYALHNEAGDTDFIFAYRLNGDFYDSQYSNANEYQQRLEMGADIVLSDEPRSRKTLDSAFFVTQQQETNFDPDTGLDRDIGGIDISQRFAYRGAGIRGAFNYQVGAWTWAADARFERRQYERVALVSNYDHELYFMRGVLAYQFSDLMELNFGLRSYRRLYDSRPARDLNGALLSTNPALHYRYTGFQIGLRRNLARSLVLGFDYELVARDDAFVGYDDYTQNIFRLSADYRPGTRSRLYARVLAGGYDYPRAFAFNTAAGGSRTLDRLDALVRYEYRLRRNVSLWAEVELDDVASSDARAEYSRTRAMLGALWRH